MIKIDLINALFKLNKLSINIMNKRINDYNSLRIRYLYLDRNILRYELQTATYKLEQNICKRIHLILKIKKNITRIIIIIKLFNRRIKIYIHIIPLLQFSN